MYYLQSRYYDPEVCRFINADSYASTGQDIIGYNMFAYCNNNPVSYFDDSGTLPCQNAMRMSNDGGGGRSINGNVPAKEQQSELNQFINNTDEQTVLDSEGLSFYKGVAVFKSKLMKSSAFSCGVIILGDKVDSVSTLRHEYGHYAHLRQIGLKKYLKYVVVPSLAGYWTNVPYNEYYSQPWEYIADILGGVERYGYNYSDDAGSVASEYWKITVFGP